MKEKIFENKLKKYLESKGIYRLGTSRDAMKVDPIGYYEKRHGSVFTGSGKPDLHICVHGHSIEVEVKCETGRLSEMQRFMINQINTAGGRALVIFPPNYEYFKEVIESYL